MKTRPLILVILSLLKCCVPGMAQLDSVVLVNQSTNVARFYVPLPDGSANYIVDLQIGRELHCDVPDGYSVTYGPIASSAFHFPAVPSSNGVLRVVVGPPYHDYLTTFDDGSEFAGGTAYGFVVTSPALIDWQGIFVTGLRWGFSICVPSMIVWMIVKGLRPSLPRD